MDINLAATPAYAGRLKTDRFYRELNSIIEVLRGRSPLRVIAMHLNNQQFSTPAGLAWTKERLAAYLKSTAFKNKE